MLKLIPCSLLHRNGFERLLKLAVARYRRPGSYLWECIIFNWTIQVVITTRNRLRSCSERSRISCCSISALCRYLLLSGVALSLLHQLEKSLLWWGSLLLLRCIVCSHLLLNRLAERSDLRRLRILDISSFVDKWLFTFEASLKVHFI